MLTGLRRRALAGLAAMAGLALAAAPAAACDRSAFTILVDVGHSPTSPGATSARGVAEYAFNLALGAQVEAQLRARGYRRTRRLLAAAGERIAAGGDRPADLLLSIHHDSVQPRYLERWTVDGVERAFSDRFAGWSLFVDGGGPQAAASLRFAQILADQLLRRGWPFTRHHAEPIPGERRPWLDARRGIHRADRLAVLRAAAAPALLFEAGVIVNRDEEARLADPARQAEIGRAVADAVDAFCAGR